MSYEFYKILHLTALITLFTSLGAIALVAKEKRKPFMILHGVSTLVMLVAGFGLLARIGMAKEFGTWVWLKLIIWLALGAMPVVLRKKPNLTLPVLLFSIALGAAAGSMALFKP
ncbi:MAG: hypothetical protein RBT63_04165 [Bdellovibrionales bacterium]|jgi:uncharacterized membrane protein SirB2|nr:hypothetical protein [Bdellovibrionales bacterium]